MATMIIEGERAQAASGDTYEVKNPATGEVVDRVPSGGEEDVDRAAKAAQKAQVGWSRLSPAERARILHKAAAHMLGKVDEIAPVLTAEDGEVSLGKGQTLYKALRNDNPVKGVPVMKFQGEKPLQVLKVDRKDFYVVVC